MTDKELFNGKCPYTSEPCEDWNCIECEVNREEQEWMERKEE